MSHLQSCPFCGADTRVNRFKKRIGKAAPHMLETAQIKCKRQTCGMSGPLFKGEGSSGRAIKHWNNCTFIACKKQNGPEKAAEEARQ